MRALPVAILIWSAYARRVIRPGPNLGTDKATAHEAGPEPLGLSEFAAARPAAARREEKQRRAAAEAGSRPLLTLKDIEACGVAGNSTSCEQVQKQFGPSSFFSTLAQSITPNFEEAKESRAPYLQTKGFAASFPFLNFVQGFERAGGYSFGWLTEKVTGLAGIPQKKWYPPVQGERMGIQSFQDYARENLGKPFPYEFFNNYYTGIHTPSWEDSTNHDLAMTMFDVGIASSRLLGKEPMDALRPLEPRFAFDQEALIKAGWNGFEDWLGPFDLKYASNGVWGISVLEALVEKYNTKGGEVLGPLMTDSVFSVHLKYNDQEALYHVDMTALEKYTPIVGYAPLGGKAAFREENGSLHMVRLEYNGSTYTDFTDQQTLSDWNTLSTRSGWRMAEGALIASLLSMTNLVLHVKDLHLELAAAFQAITVDSFADDVTHPVRKFLDPFILRSGQATNDNFKLLFEYKAAEFSLAPLEVDEQLRLIDDFIREQPLNLAELDMETYGELRNMPKEVSSRESQQNESTWGWRWHYRSLEMQRLYASLADCRLSQYYKGDVDIANDVTLNEWWRSMLQHMPSVARAVQHNPDWASEDLTYDSLNRVLRVLLVWLSWIHEDVGHSAASYVYNAVSTPMCVPEDGVGVPMNSYVFNTGAYRGMVFLERPQLLDEPPSFWFDTEECSGILWWKTCKPAENDPGLKCMEDFQAGLRRLGEEDQAFSECGKTGFYSCVDRVETAVSS